jgi:6-phosphogluconolactonase
MRTRFTWIVAVLALVSIGFAMACSTKYSSSSNGLVVVPTQGSAVMQTFSLDLNNGHAAQINNVNGPPIPGLAKSVILDPTGTFVYVLVTQNPTLPAGTGNITGIATFKVASDGKLTSIAGQTLNPESIYFNGQSNPPETVPPVPVALTMDSAGKFIFVADSATADSAGNQIPGAVSVFSVGSNASLSEVANSPFVLPVNGVSAPFPGPCLSTLSCSSASALAVTPTVFPAQFAACSGVAPPTTENLYVADSLSYVLLNYSVDTTAGMLTLKAVSPTVAGVPTGTVPSGVAVDACNRFVYVANAQSNNISAYTICSAASQTCTQGDYRLLVVPGSPYSVGDLPGPIEADAYGNFLYVVNTGSSTISAFRMSSATGTLTPLSPATVATSSGPSSIAIRADDSWLFVADINSATVSQYAITPATGALTPQAPITTLTYPSGVAVK